MRKIILCAALLLSGCEEAAILIPVGVVSALSGATGARIAVSTREDTCRQKPTVKEMCDCWQGLDKFVPTPRECWQAQSP